MVTHKSQTYFCLLVAIVHTRDFKFDLFYLVFLMSEKNEFILVFQISEEVSFF